MNWRIFFSKIKFSRFILLFLFILTVTGLIMVWAGENKLVPAVLIYSLSIILSYLKSIGIFILWIDKGNRIKGYLVMDNTINLIVFGLFGWKFAALTDLSVWSWIIYILLWTVYLVIIYRSFIINANYMIYHMRSGGERRIQ